MRRREFITLLGGTFTAWPLPVSAEPKATAVVGFLGAVRDDKLTSAFEMRLRDLGWMVGQNLSIEYRWADGDLARLPVRLKADLMLAGNNQAAIIMPRAIAVIPIVVPT